MSVGPLERRYGKYRITLRKAEHILGRWPSPHVEIWKGNRKVGNYDMASGRTLFKPSLETPREIQKAIEDFLNDNQVKHKIKEMIKESYFDLSKPMGDYGGIPRGFKVTITVEFTEESLSKRLWKK